MTARMFTPMTLTMPTWLPDYWRLAARCAVIGWSSQAVIATRLSMMAFAPKQAATRRESQVMVAEKIKAAQQAALQLQSVSMKIAFASPQALTDPVAANRVIKQSINGAYAALAPYERRVVSNRKRLTGV